MDEQASKFLRGALSEAQPPENPLVIKGWAALAFDRNLYEDLAPPDVWEAWLATHAELAGSDIAFRVLSVKDFNDGLKASTVRPDMESLRAYWEKDASFLFDHYVFSPVSRSLVRLDQDVTLFAGEVEFVAAVVGRLGGIDRVMSMMIHDFEPGEPDSTGLQGFLNEITQPLRR
jgi:hypothetical protein